MTTGPELDILGIGNAIVDVLASSDDATVAAHGLAKGSMNLIDAERADALYAELGAGATESGGGSCANTVVCAAALGSRVAYVGKVRDDALGEAFTADIRAVGATFETAPADSGPGTARCIIMVTPDGQRTMNTYLGACVGLGPADVDPELVGRAKVTYLEGYLWDPPQAKEAFRVAMAAARAAGREVSLTLSDTFCVERFREEFRALVAEDIDVLFANEDEIRALYEVDMLDEALARVPERCAVVAVTRSEKGSVVFARGERHEVPAEPVDPVVDTTGAGDAYAAGFLHGHTHGLTLPACARLGAIAAAEVISHVGPRPQADLAELAGPALTGDR